MLITKSYSMFYVKYFEMMKKIKKISRPLYTTIALMNLDLYITTTSKTPDKLVNGPLGIKARYIIS